MLLDPAGSRRAMALHPGRTCREGSIANMPKDARSCCGDLDLSDGVDVPDGWVMHEDHCDVLFIH